MSFSTVSGIRAGSTKVRDSTRPVASVEATGADLVYSRPRWPTRCCVAAFSRSYTRGQEGATRASKEASLRQRDEAHLEAAAVRLGGQATSHDSGGSRPHPAGSSRGVRVATRDDNQVPARSPSARPACSHGGQDLQVRSDCKGQGVSFTRRMLRSLHAGLSPVSQLQAPWWSSVDG